MLFVLFQLLKHIPSPRLIKNFLLGVGWIVPSYKASSDFMFKAPWVKVFDTVD